jgi:hypothetical protein
MNCYGNGYGMNDGMEWIRMEEFGRRTFSSQATKSWGC